MSNPRRSFLSGWARAAISGSAIGLMLLLSGDRARTAFPSPLPIDPLEILRLQVRPNVIFVLDSSGSMREDLTAATNNLGDNHPRAKMRLAKDTVDQFILDNQTTVSFQFGQYNQPGNETELQDSGNNRFLYSIDSAPGATFASTPAASIRINPGGSGASNGRLYRERANTGAAPCNAATLPITPGDVCGSTQIDVDGTATHKLIAGKFFNQQTVVVLEDTDSTTDGVVCSTTPANPVNGANPAWVDIVVRTGLSCADAAATDAAAVRFDFHGIEGDWGNPGSACNGFFGLVDLQPCTNLDQYSLIHPYLLPSLAINADGSIQGTTNDDWNVTVTSGVNDTPTPAGMKAGGLTPIGNTIIDIKSYFDVYYNGGAACPNGGNPCIPAGITPISAQNPKQRTFLIFVTDGDDTCPDSGESGATADQLALRAAHKAQLLYTRIVATDAASGVPTYVILFGSGPAKSRGDWIAYGGSGMALATTLSGTARRWANSPTLAQINACTTCVPAFSAANAQDLADALQSVISQVIGQGEFSASAPIVATVFELVVDTNLGDTIDVSPLVPTTRYNQRINILYQSTFDLPSWRGRLFAFRNDGTFQVVGTSTNSLGIWEAGQTLFDKVTTVMQGTDLGHGFDEFTFAELHSGATPRAIATSNAVIKRRVFTSNGNGTFARTATGLNHVDPQFDASDDAGSNLVALWPPDQTDLTSGIGNIDPAVGTVGPLDAALGIASLTYLELQSATGACLASTDAGFGAAPAACNFVANATLATDTARKEARQMLLAHIAGAQPSAGTDDLPKRLPAASSEPNAMLFSSRGWLLQDNQNAAVVVASPPLQFDPGQHVGEFLLYRDGRRAVNANESQSGQGIDEHSIGFGLRNPDFDNLNAKTLLNLKPVMTVVYFGGNDGIHAFRAGPQCAGGTCGAGENGSEELWHFVPFDQLVKIKELAVAQVTNPHIYMIASSLRLASVFVPDSDGFTIDEKDFFGRWRTVLFFGRGAGGQSYTALDVTSPGVFTTAALESYPPWVMWTRGNPDTADGTAGGALNHNTTDRDFYADMGQTWAIPAVGPVKVGSVCPVTSQPVEWRVFVGSGYGDPVINSNMGKRFYQLDAVTGDVCQSSLLDNGDTTYIDHNALVAGASGFLPKAQDPPGSIQRDPIDYVTRIYQPDLHGRIWRFSPESGGILYSAGANQPFGTSMALLKINGAASVFAESGNDTRVPDNAGPFKIFGIEDAGSEFVYTPPPLGSLLFAFNMDIGSGTRIRGTVQPATFFNASGQPRAFFAGTRFNPAGVGSCLSSFDTILFAVSGSTGGAVYDFSGDGTADLYTIIQGNKATGLTSGGGALIVGESGALGSAPTPTPDPNPTPTPAPPRPPTIQAASLRTNSPVCRTP